MARESLADKKIRATKIIKGLKKRYPDASCALVHGTVHQLMVATILSAQCTDERVNMVTPALFERFSTVDQFAEAPLEEIEKLIHSTGFFHAKAKSIKNSAVALIERFGGEMPRTIEELITLPGVGRKTASVILGVGFGISEGIVVDTHVTRISKLLGLTSQTEPVKIEADLMKILPRGDWINFSHLMIWHGRAICKARKPECDNCPIATLCPSAQV